jgi:hypothetical protein
MAEQRFDDNSVNSFLALAPAAERRYVGPLETAPKMKIPTVAMVVVLGGMVACKASERQSTAAISSAGELFADAPRVKIWISKSGAIELDGQPADLQMVESRLASLAQQKGVVFYGREAAAEDPHPNGPKVIQMVIANRLPIRMSTKRDFSDAVVGAKKE